MRDMFVRPAFFASGDQEPTNSLFVISPLPKWRPFYWLYAGLIPLALYSLEALKISLYHVARSPNLDLLPHLAVMLTCYSLWALVPRFSWAFLYRLSQGGGLTPAKTAAPLAGLGLCLAGVHLLCFTIAKLVLFATQAWMWRPVHFLHNYGEVWLGFGGLWLFTYVITVAIILSTALQRHDKDVPPSRYEVKDNGKTLSIPLNDIYWIRAAGNYVEMHTARGVTMVRKTLTAIEKEFNGAGFLKSHRSALINGRSVNAIKPLADSSGYVVQLSNGDEAPLSRRRLSDFKSLLKTVE